MALVRAVLRRELSDAAAVRGDAPADLGAPGAGGLAEKLGHHTRASGIVFEQSLREHWSVFKWPRGPSPEALTSDKWLLSHDCELCKPERPSRADLLLSGAIGPLRV